MKELEDGILKYPKSLFTKIEVLKEKNNMGTPGAWIFEEDKDNYYLSFSEYGYDVIHKLKKKSENIPDFMRI